MKNAYVYTILAVMALVFVLREIDCVKSKSATYDEAYFISMGWTTMKTGDYRLYSRKKNPETGKRRNLGTFTTRAAAEQHEREIQYFKRQ